MLENSTIWLKNMAHCFNNALSSKDISLSFLCTRSFVDEFVIVPWLWDCPTPVQGVPLILVLWKFVINNNDNNNYYNIIISRSIFIIIIINIIIIDITSYVSNLPLQNY